MTETDIDTEVETETPKGGFRELLSTVLWALGIAFVLRTFIFQPFHIPSGSMMPGLVKGDYIITSKFTVGYGKHAATPFPFPVSRGRLFERELSRGDVIVFRPKGETKTFIKRVIGLPGDRVQVKHGHVYINGEQVPLEKIGIYDKEKSYGYAQNSDLLRETLPSGRKHIVLDSTKNKPLYDDTKPYDVPVGHYFMMGDNRDNSLDSRFLVDKKDTKKSGAGLVPKENIIGKAEVILLSANEDFVLFKPWTWLNMRKDRWFKAIK